MLTDAIPTCTCPTCVDPRAAMAADLAANGMFRCATCGAVRLLPAATSDDADCVGDPPRMVPAGAPVCGPCARKAMPDAPVGYLEDGTDDTHRGCCGECPPWKVCECSTVTFYGVSDGEPYSDDGCVVHRCRA